MKNTENWKMSMDTIYKTGKCWTKRGLHKYFSRYFFFSYLFFKHSIIYEINKIKNARILYS
jgi:hypothetical protein